MAMTCKRCFLMAHYPFVTRLKARQVCYLNVPLGFSMMHALACWHAVGWGCGVSHWCSPLCCRRQCSLALPPRAVLWWSRLPFVAPHLKLQDRYGISNLLAVPFAHNCQIYCAFTIQPFGIFVSVTGMLQAIAMSTIQCACQITSTALFSLICAIFTFICKGGRRLTAFCPDSGSVPDCWFCSRLLVLLQISCSAQKYSTVQQFRLLLLIVQVLLFSDAFDDWSWDWHTCRLSLQVLWCLVTAAMTAFCEVVIHAMDWFHFLACIGAQRCDQVGLMSTLPFLLNTML